MLVACKSPSTKPTVQSTEPKTVEPSHEDVEAQGHTHTALPPLSTRLCAGGLHACFITDARDVYCWGLARNLERGRATKIHGVQGAVEVSCGYEDSCARTGAGQVFCWGDEAPTRIEGLEPARSIGVGTRACAVLDDGTVRCTAPENAIEQPAIEDAVEVGVGFYHACARTTSGEVRCWGRNLNGQLGVSPETFTKEDGRSHEDLWLGTLFYTKGEIVSFDRLVSSKRFWTRPFLECVRGADILDTIRDVRLGVEVLVRPDGSFESVGAGGRAQTVSPPDRFLECLENKDAIRGLAIPHGDPKPRTMFIEFMVREKSAMALPVHTVLHGATDLDVRGYLSCATTDEGDTKCWGMGHAYDGPGIIGEGFDAMLGPRTIEGLEGAKRVTVGWRNQCVEGQGQGQEAATTVRCFGASPAREFAVGPEASDGTVVRVRALERFSQIVIGPTVGCGLDENGAPWCWGSNDAERLGVGLDEGGRHAPAAVVGLPKAAPRSP